VARAVLLSYPLTIEPVGVEDAERAAELWSAGTGLSLADRMCLALADRVDGVALTADTAWAGMARVHQVR
jgi:PIN domain nuclease of toxin-antitoxin system